MSEKKLIRANQMIYDEIKGRYRRISLFLSSTFEDMERERDYLIDRLPEMFEQWGEFYGLEVDVIDLRWGIGIEDGNRGRTVPMCLKAVSDSIPFVISLVGSRRGWIPGEEDIPDSIRHLMKHPEALDKHHYSTGIEKSVEGLKAHLGSASMTELEIYQAIAEGDEKNVLFLVKSDPEEKNENEALRKLALSHGGKEYRKEADGIFVGEERMEDHIFSYVVERCKEILSEKVFVSHDGIRKEFLYQSFLYGKYLSECVFRKNEEEILDQFFISGKTRMEITADCGLNSCLAAFFYVLEKSYSVDLVLSFGELDMEMLGYQMDRMGRDISELYNRRKAADAYGMHKVIVILAKSLSDDVSRLIDGNTNVYAVTAAGSGRSDVFEYALPDLAPEGVREYLERKLQRKAKHLSEKQLNDLKLCAPLKKITELNDFLETLFEEEDYILVDVVVSEYVKAHSQDQEEGAGNFTLDEDPQNHDPDMNEFRTSLKRLCELHDDAVMEEHTNEERVRLLTEAFEMNRAFPNYRMRVKSEKIVTEEMLEKSKHILGGMDIWSNKKRTGQIINYHRVLFQLAIMRGYVKEHEDDESLEYTESLMKMYGVLDDMICCFSYDHYDLSGRILNRAYDQKGWTVRDFSLFEDYRSRPLHERLDLLKELVSYSYGTEYYQIPLIRAATYVTVDGVEKLDHVEDFVFAEKEKALSIVRRREVPITTLRGEKESLF